MRMSIVLLFNLFYTHATWTMYTPDDSKRLLLKRELLSTAYQQEIPVPSFVGRFFCPTKLNFYAQKLQELDGEIRQNIEEQNSTWVSITNRQFFGLCPQGTKATGIELYRRNNTTFPNPSLLYLPDFSQPTWSSLTHITLQSINLSVLQLNLFDDACRLKYLDVSHNMITDILYASNDYPYTIKSKCRASFGNHKHCPSELNISHNKLGDINFDRLFAVFPCIKKVDLSYNRELAKMSITSIPATYKGGCMGRFDDWESPMIDITCTKLNTPSCKKQLQHAYKIGTPADRSGAILGVGILALCGSAALAMVHIYAGEPPDALEVSAGIMCTLGAVGAEFALRPTTFLTKKIKRYIDTRILDRGE
jgi:hypothetical protein